MQRFPADYDGIISGANGPDTPAMTTRRMWEIMLRDKHEGLMARADWELVAAQGVKGCDALDGVTDGVADDPRRCKLDLAPVRCKGAATKGCLTQKQIDFTTTLYGPLRDEDGKKVDDGLLPGVLIDNGRSQLAIGTFGRAIRGKQDWNGEGFNVRDDFAAIDRVMPELRADVTDLAPYRERGGKVIMYHGWIDPAVAARMIVSYYERLEQANGGRRKAADFARLYMVPGMLHCGGGPGADQFGGAGRDGPAIDAEHDMLSALEAWVEQGKAPDSLVASKIQADKVVRTRRLCPYPRVAKYRGSGSSDEASSYACVASQ
jgi:feruloyl esterase